MDMHSGSCADDLWEGPLLPGHAFHSAHGVNLRSPTHDVDANKPHFRQADGLSIGIEGPSQVKAGAAGGAGVERAGVIERRSGEIGGREAWQEGGGRQSRRWVGSCRHEARALGRAERSHARCG